MMRDSPAHIMENLPVLRTIHLHGTLGDQFQPSYQLRVKSPAEAIRALCAQVRGLDAAIVDGHFHCIAGAAEGGRDMDVADITRPWYHGEVDFHLIPVVAGAGNKGGVKIVVGLIIMAAAIWFSGGIAAAGLATAAGTSTGAAFGAAMGVSAIGVAGIGTFTQIAMFGLMIAMGGIAQLISPQPSTAGATTTAANPSFLFSGISNTDNQGVCVPVVYGEVIVGSISIVKGIKPETITGVLSTKSFSKIASVFGA